MTNEGKSNGRDEEMGEGSRQESDDQIAKNFKQVTHAKPYGRPAYA
jgi:hypothetical protein